MEPKPVTRKNFFVFAVDLVRIQSRQYSLDGRRIERNLFVFYKRKGWFVMPEKTPRPYVWSVFLCLMYGGKLWNIMNSG
jgi:hypothetical protein